MRMRIGEDGYRSRGPGEASGHQVSIQARFLPSRADAGGSEFRPITSHLRVSAGSMTSSTSNTVPALRARDQA